MAVLSSIEQKLDLRGYAQDPMHALAEQFVDTARSAHQESGLDIFGDPGRFMKDQFTKGEMKKFFVENSYDPKDPKFQNPSALREHMDNMETLFENDANQIMQEATALGEYNPVIGMALPMHKNILMNAVFDQVMPKDVAKGPKFTLTMEVRNLVDIKGNVIDLFAEQNKIRAAVDESIPVNEFMIKAADFNKPTGNIVTDYFVTPGIIANGRNVDLSMKTYVNKVLVTGYAEVGDTVADADGVESEATAAGTATLVFNIDGKFVPSYGPNSRILNKRIALNVPISATDSETVYINMMGSIEDNKITLMAGVPLLEDGTASTNVQLNGVKVNAVLDVSSAAFPTVKVKWSATTDFYEIPEAPHITCPITPEEVKDIQALYDVNQVTKLMSMMRLVLLHWKDDSIHKDLDNSFLTMPATNKVAGALDWTPPLNYNNTPTEWRRAMFMDQLDMYVTRMLNVLNDENMTIAVFGRPELIKRITPQQFTYQTPSNIGPVELDFTRTIVTSEKRVYNFVSTQKMRNNNNLIVLLIPRNSMRITYKIIDYQMYISSEIRDHEQYELPAMTCFERWYFLSYQPVQGRIRILNPSGLRENIQLQNEKDYIGENAMNDFTANTEQYSSEVNGVIDTEVGSPTEGHVKVPPVTVK
ncbi:MAG: hypothetical protein IJ193_00730 [Bacilli bacterium]|nr:hypothetical protein [Bacilli bacterium]